MSAICTETVKLDDPEIFGRFEKKYGFRFEDPVKAFFKENNGGIPDRGMIEINGDEYEIRCFLSFNSGEYNSIDIPLESFQKETHGKMIPIAKDSGDNYYCIHVETNKIYYWDKDEDLYYNLADSLETFLQYLH